MDSIVLLDEKTRRKCFLDEPDDLKADEQITFILNLHGGGSHGTWQHLYFPAQDYKNKYRLAIATPSAATREPTSHWAAEADDDHLRNLVELVVERYGRKRIKSFWLAGHSQGGMTSNRLLRADFFADRVDGWLSLSGGRIGPVEHKVSFFAGRDRRPPFPTPAPGALTSLHECDFSFIFAVGELEIERLPETSPWRSFTCTSPSCTWSWVTVGFLVDGEGLGELHYPEVENLSYFRWGGRKTIFEQRVPSPPIQINAYSSGKSSIEGLETRIVPWG